MGYLHVFLVSSTVCLWFFMANGTSAASFSDVSTSHPFSEGIAYISERAFMPGYTDGTFRPYHRVTRGQLANIVVQTKFTKDEIDACNIKKLSFRDVRARNALAPYVCVARSKGLMKGVSDRTFRPTREVTLVEAAVVLTRAFDVELPSNFAITYVHIYDGETIRVPPAWYKAPLVALGERNAIPASFFEIDNTVTRGELAEMIYRLSENIIDRPSRIFESVDFHEGPYEQSAPSPEMPENREYLRIYGVLAQSVFPSFPFTESMMRQFFEPAHYFIDPDTEGSLRQCSGYYAADSVAITTSNTLQKIQFDGHGDYCTVLESKVSSEEKCSLPLRGTGCGNCSTENGKETCDLMVPTPYSLTLVRENGRLRIEGSQSDHIQITRRPIERLAVEFGTAWLYSDATPTATRVETVGTLEVQDLPYAKRMYHYRTAWKSIFGDLRGVHFLMASTLHPDGSTWVKFYRLPEHNLNPGWTGFTPYEDCLRNALSKHNPMQFCMKREGNDFVVSSPKELGDHTTFWIDERYKR